MVYLLLFLAILCAIVPFYALAVSPLILLYPAFLFMAIQNRSLHCIELLIWAGILATFEYLPIIDALIYMAPDNSLLALIPGTLLILSTASYSMCWLFFSQKYITHRPLSNQLIVWTMSLFLYLIIKDQLYLFCNPLLPLSYYPRLAAPLCAVPQWIALLWFAGFTSAVAWLFAAPGKLTALALLVITIPWIIITQPPACQPPWLNTIGHLPITIAANASLEASSALLAHELCLLKQQFPRLTTVILPESAWNSTNLSQTPVLALLQQNPIPNFFIGSFLTNQEKCYNTVYQYHKGRLMSKSSKRHLLPLTEQPIPLPLCQNLYFEKSSPISCCQESKPLITLSNPALTAVIYICSELFFNTTPDDPYQCPIIAVTNDWWFRMAHFCRLMANAARLRAMQWKRPIIYVSYKHAYYFDTAGKCYPLITCSQSRLFNF